MSRDVYPSYRIPTQYLPMSGSPMGVTPYPPYQFMYTQPMPTTASMTTEPTAHHTVAQQEHSPVKVEQPPTRHVTVKPEPPPYPSYNMPSTGSPQNGYHGTAFSPGTAINVPLAPFGQPHRPAAGPYPLSVPLPVSSPGQVLPSAMAQSSPQTMTQVPGRPAVNGIPSNIPVPTQPLQQQALSAVVSTVSEIVESLPPSLTQSEAFRSHTCQSLPSQHSDCTYGDLAMAPPKQIPKMNRWGSQPNLSTTKQETVMKLQSEISSPHTPGLEAPSTSQDYPRHTGSGGLAHFAPEYSVIGGPTSQAVLNSPTYPIMAQSALSPQPLPPISDSSFNAAYQPTLIRRNRGSRSSSPTNSIISVGSAPSMRPHSIHSERSHSVSGDLPASIDLSHRSHATYKDPELPPYSSSHAYRSRSPNGSCASSYSSISGSRPGSVRSSLYSDQSHSTHSRSRGSAFSGPVTASLSSAHIAPPNPHQVYITLDDLLQAEPTLALSPLDTTSSDIMPGDELIHLANQTLKQIVNWAKQIHAFISLPQGTQMTLMKHCWGELLCFVLAVRTARENEREKAMGLPDQAGYPEATYAFQRMALDLTKWVVERQLDEIELACLKVIILLDPGEQTFNPCARKQNYCSHSVLRHLVDCVHCVLV